MNKKFEFLERDSMYVVNTGGVSLDLILQTLRILYMGDVRFHERIQTLEVLPDQPIRFFHCFRRYLAPESEGMSTRSVVEEIQRQNARVSITYELGLRWFLASPVNHIYFSGADPKRPIIVLPTSPIEIDGKPQALVFSGGRGAGVYVGLEGLDLDKPFSACDYLSAHELIPSPFNS